MLADLAVSVASSVPYLGGNGGGKMACVGLETVATRVLYIDFDTNRKTLHERLRAFGRGRTLTIPGEMLKTLCSFDPFSIGDRNDVDDFTTFVRKSKAGLVIVETLTDISAGLDENAPDMGRALGELRRVATSLDVCLVLVTHARKGDLRRTEAAADALRGSSSILAKLDVALLVRWNPVRRTIEISGVKCRGPEIRLISALFDHKSDRRPRQLLEASYRLLPGTNGVRRAEIEQSVRAELKRHGEMSKRGLRDTVLKIGVASDKIVRSEIGRLVDTGIVLMRINGRTHLVRLADAS